MSSVSSEELLSIGELARRVGATPSALRYWERAGLLPVAGREGGRRRYDLDAVARVGLIRVCQDAGFGIGEIRSLLEVDPTGTGEWRARASSKLAEVRARIATLEATATLLEHTLACPAPSLSQCSTFTSFVERRASGS